MTETYEHDAGAAFLEAFQLDTEQGDNTDVDHLAKGVRENTKPAVEWLRTQKISEAAIERALRNQALGYNERRSPTIAQGKAQHGGPAVAYIVRTLNPGKVVAVDEHYLNPEEAGQPVRRFGAYRSHGWTADVKWIHQAHTVYITLTPLEALAIDSCNMGGVAAFAIRDYSAIDTIDFSFLADKIVRICLPHTDPLDEHSLRPGLAGAWKLHERLTAEGISALLVDQEDWEPGERVIDRLQEVSEPSVLATDLRKAEPWLIAGLPSQGETSQFRDGRRRVFLPAQDWAIYWRYRISNDHTQFIKKMGEASPDGDAKPINEVSDICGFRIVAISKVAVQSYIATTQGVADTQQDEFYAVTAQTPAHGAKLQRKIVRYEQLNKLDVWPRFGTVYDPRNFARMVNILMRSTQIAQKTVSNYIGLCWRDGVLTPSEGKDCYFMEPEKQSTYYGISFPRGSKDNARAVIAAMQATFKDNAAAMVMVWVLGCHLKTVYEFWPHFEMEARKGSGKSTLLRKFQALLSVRQIDTDAVKTDYRTRASLGYSSHPVMLDEISRISLMERGKLDGWLQKAFGWTYLTVGTEMLPHLIATPVLLIGEEVEFPSLQSKLVKTSISAAGQGAEIPNGMPPFPSWNWMEFLASAGPNKLREAFDAAMQICLKTTSAEHTDATARRMIKNYAAVLAAWHLLCEFAEIDITQGDFTGSLVREMNRHIAETEGSRQPWVSIMEMILLELAGDTVDFPHKWGMDATHGEMLYLRPNDVMHYLGTANHLRSKFSELPVKSGRIFKQQLLESGVVVLPDVEKEWRGRRMAHMVGISLEKLERYGLEATPNKEALSGVGA
ncbi:hypothetical protein [Chitinimonas taiwanensis]|uniref:hypothetical protein n=1 Tax=Chitinimonas taiwanensis TaxID=240412 RepID=UPI0035AFCDD4